MSSLSYTARVNLEICKAFGSSSLTLVVDCWMKNRFLIDQTNIFWWIRGSSSWSKVFSSQTNLILTYLVLVLKSPVAYWKCLTCIIKMCRLLIIVRQLSGEGYSKIITRLTFFFFFNELLSYLTPWQHPHKEFPRLSSRGAEWKKLTICCYIIIEPFLAPQVLLANSLKHSFFERWSTHWLARHCYFSHVDLLLDEKQSG